MTDVLNLQRLLDSGAPPAVLYAVIDDGPVVIPDDGKEHDCVCGHPGYRVTDNDGYLPPSVADDEGRSASYCHGCDRELEAGPKKDR